jgi:pilus assembly protein CpaF
MTSLHANTPRDALSRLETMVLMAGTDLPLRAIRDQIRSAVHLIIQQERLQDGTRQVTEIAEVQGMEGDVIVLEPIFRFVSQGVDGRRVIGRLESMGVRPKLAERLERQGQPLAASLFRQRVTE